MRQEVRIGYQTFKAEPEHRVLQCLKCQKSGHSAWNCIYKHFCLKCSGPHCHKECTTSELKCANCQQNHAVCSRQCPSLQRPKSSIKKPIGTILSGPSGSPCPKPTFSQVLSQPNRSNNQHASPAKLQKNIEDMITVSIEAKINELMVTLTNHITKLITNLLAPISQNNRINNANLTAPRPQTTLQQQKDNITSNINPSFNQHILQLQNLNNIVQLLSNLNSSMSVQKDSHQHNNHASSLKQNTKNLSFQRPISGGQTRRTKALLGHKQHPNLLYQWNMA